MENWDVSVPILG